MLLNLLVILKMKIIKSKYECNPKMLAKYFPIFEKIAESTGATFILVRNHYPILYYCRNTECFENEAEKGDWEHAYPNVLIAPDAYHDKLHFLIAYEKHNNERINLDYSSDEALENVIKTFRTGVIKVKNYQINLKKKGIEKDFCEVQNVDE